MVKKSGHCQVGLENLVSASPVCLISTHLSPYFLTLMEMKMTNMNSNKTTNAIRADSLIREIPIVAMTA